MIENFDKGLDIVLGLEGKVVTKDPNDPGGLTIWGLSKRYNPEIYVGMPEADIRGIYYRKYWQPAGCDIADYPLDICLFDGIVNPQNDPALPFAGNAEIMAMNPKDWEDFLMLRMVRYMKNSKRVYVLGHLQRILRLYEKLRS